MPGSFGQDPALGIHIIPFLSLVLLELVLNFEPKYLDSAAIVPISLPGSLLISSHLYASDPPLCWVERSCLKMCICVFHAEAVSEALGVMRSLEEMMSEKKLSTPTPVHRIKLRAWSSVFICKLHKSIDRKSHTSHHASVVLIVFLATLGIQRCPIKGRWRLSGQSSPPVSPAPRAVLLWCVFVYYGQNFICRNKGFHFSLKQVGALAKWCRRCLWTLALSSRAGSQNTGPRLLHRKQKCSTFLFRS